MRINYLLASLNGKSGEKVRFAAFMLCDKMKIISDARREYQDESINTNSLIHKYLPKAKEKSDSFKLECDQIPSPVNPPIITDDSGDIEFGINDVLDVYLR